MTSFIQQYLSEIIALLALLGVISANRIAEKARRIAVQANERSTAIAKAEKRTEMLVEIELKNAAVGNMLFVITRKILLFQEHPDLANKYPDEHMRLNNNLKLMREFQEKEEYERKVAEEATNGNAFSLQQQALTDVRRLRVRLESEVQKESEGLESLIREIGAIGA